MQRKTLFSKPYSTITSLKHSAILTPVCWPLSCRNPITASWILKLASIQVKVTAIIDKWLVDVQMSVVADTLPKQENHILIYIKSFTCIYNYNQTIIAVIQKFPYATLAEFKSSKHCSFDSSSRNYVEFALECLNKLFKERLLN